MSAGWLQLFFIHIDFWVHSNIGYLVERFYSFYTFIFTTSVKKDDVCREAVSVTNNGEEAPESEVVETTAES